MPAGDFNPNALAVFGNNVVDNCNIGWVYPFLQQPYTYTWTYTPPVAPHGVETSAVCDHCQKREKVAVIPEHWVKLYAGTSHAVLCSWACAEKYSKANVKK